MDIQDYSFVDCVLIDFKVDQSASYVEIVSEAHYPAENTQSYRKKGRIKVRMEQLFRLEMEMVDEFHHDILKEYSADGHDTKANEVYFIQAMKKENAIYLRLDSDFLKLEAQGKFLEVQQLD